MIWENFLRYHGMTILKDFRFGLESDQNAAHAKKPEITLQHIENGWYFRGEEGTFWPWCGSGRLWIWKFQRLSLPILKGFSNQRLASRTS